MRRLLLLARSRIGTKLSLGFGALVGLTLLVAALALLGGRDATRDIEVSVSARAPASLASAQAQEALLRMQLHLRGYLVLSESEDVEQYQAAQRTFEKALAALQQLAAAWPAADQQQVKALAEGYGRWKLLPPQLFALHDDPLRNRPALRLSRVDVQAQRVKVLTEVEAMIAQQRGRATNEAQRETLAMMLMFQSSFDALATNVMAFGASGEANFKLTYSPQLVTNASIWNALIARRSTLTPPQREQLDRIGAARAALTELALRVRAILDSERAYEDLYLYRSQVVPQAQVLLDLLQRLTAEQQTRLQADLARARASLARSRVQTVAGALLALALGIGMAYGLRRSIVGPVQRLTAVAGRIAGGDLRAQARAEAPDEIGMLAASFNAMTARLAESIARLETAYADAQQARQAAESANSAKSRFLANISHELRTPLNAVLGYAQLLRGGTGLGAREAAGLDTIHRSGEHLLLLIDDMLDFARIEAGKIELFTDAVDLGELQRTVCDIVRLEAQRKALEFESIGPGPLPLVHADEKRLRQVLLNLLNNAVKFTQAGRVTLRILLLEMDDRRARLRFEVEDTGIGIVPEQLERIFRPFEQAADVQRRFGGTGLGLAISRQLVMLMGSDIRVESRVGAGSTFRFDLDLPLAARAPEPQAPEIQAIGGYEGPRRRVLVVDDIDANRSPVVHFLGALGFETLEAENGDAAIRCAEAWAPDIVLMDSQMPVMDGLEATRRLRRIERFRTLPIVAVSANASATDEQACRAAGADLFLRKPLDLARLLREIGRLLGLSWRWRAAEAESGNAALIEPPPPQELAGLLQVARLGNMRAIRSRAEQLAAHDGRYRPLCDRLCRLADEFESLAIVDLLASLQAQAAQREASPAAAV